MSYSNYKRVRIETEGRLLTATLNNPPMNLITQELLDELGAFTDELAADPGALVLVIKSADPDFFIPHAELATLYAMQPDAPPASPSETSPNSIHRICERIRTMDKVSIAQVEGRAGGGGAALVMACDMRFGAIGKAIFNNMAVPFGSVPGGGASQYMPRLIGRARSLELILGGIDLDAVTAERWGYLNRALAPEQIDEFVHGMASRIAGSSPDAVRLTRALVVAAEERPVVEGLREESFSLQRLMASDRFARQHPTVPGDRRADPRRRETARRTPRRRHPDVGDDLTSQP